MKRLLIQQRVESGFKLFFFEIFFLSGGVFLHHKLKLFKLYILLLIFELVINIVLKSNKLMTFKEEDVIGNFQDYPRLSKLTKLGSTFTL